MAFLTSSSCAGAPTRAESPKRIPVTSVYIHIHIHTSTSRDRDSSGLRRGPGPRAKCAQHGGLCHPTLSTEDGREQVLKRGPDKGQTSSCCCHAKQRLVEDMQPPQQPKPTNCVARDTQSPFTPALRAAGTGSTPALWHSTVQQPVGSSMLAIAPCPARAHATGRACWAFTSRFVLALRRTL